jgi:predicted nucleotidyltransferase
VSLPNFTDTGDLPVGIHPAPLPEASFRFGTGSARRKFLALRLRRIHRLAVQTSHLARFVVFGSFVTAKLEPNDVDVFMIMDDNFDVSRLSGESRRLFDHAAAQTHFGCSVFWVRRLAALGGEQATLEHWQIKRDGTKRGIVEIAME